VTRKRTGEFYQAKDLIKRELVPSDWTPPHVDAKRKPLKYPLKHVNEIISKRLADGSEWLVSRQQWWGLDQAGNPVNQSMDDKELCDDILPIYKCMVRMALVLSSEIVYPVHLELIPLQ
jgi:hypothetical protein